MLCLLINCMSLSKLLNFSELLISMLFCELLLLGVKDHQTALCIHLDYFRMTEYTSNIGCSRHTKTRKRKWREYNWKLKYKKFSASFMIIIGFSSKPFQALYTYYVVQAKSWGVCRKKSLPLPFSRGEPENELCSPYGQEVLSPYPQPPPPVWAQCLVCFMKQWLCNLPEGRWAENKNARNGKLVIKKLSVITCALMQRSFTSGMTGHDH